MGKDIGDEDLMMSYQAGNAASFETLYQRHKGAASPANYWSG